MTRRQAADKQTYFGNHEIENHRASVRLFSFFAQHHLPSDSSTETLSYVLSRWLSTFEQFSG